MTDKVALMVCIVAVTVWAFFAIVGAIHISGGC